MDVIERMANVFLFPTILGKSVWPERRYGDGNDGGHGSSLGHRSPAARGHRLLSLRSDTRSLRVRIFIPFLFSNSRSLGFRLGEPYSTLLTLFLFVHMLRKFANVCKCNELSLISDA
jgi:hypothetical protein